MSDSKWKFAAHAQRNAYRWGLIVAIVAGALLVLPGRESWHAAGPRNVGHTKTNCGECHVREGGNVVSQTFNTVLHDVGLSDLDSYVGFKPVGNEQCLDCHDNPDDRHPVADFLEPKFAQAREAMGVQSCVNCHQEHLGVRVSVTQSVCQYCHEDTEVEDDPVDIPHSTLFADKRWETCLGCHDFHGNHERKTPKMMSEVLSKERIQQYFDGGKSPYGYRRLTVIQTMRRKAR